MDGARRGDGVDIGGMFARLTIAVLDHELGGHLCGGRLQLIVHATFKTAGCLGWNLVATCGTCDRHLIEMRGFKQDVLGLGGHLTV